MLPKQCHKTVAHNIPTAGTQYPHSWFTISHSWHTISPQLAYSIHTAGTQYPHSWHTISTQLAIWKSGKRQTTYYKGSIGLEYTAMWQVTALNARSCPEGEPAGSNWSHLLSRESLQGPTGPLVVYSLKPIPSADRRSFCYSSPRGQRLGLAFTVHTFDIPRGTTELDGILFLRTVVCTRAVGATRSAEGDAGRKGEQFGVCCVAHSDNAGQNGCDERSFLHTIRVVPVQDDAIWTFQKTT